MKVEQIYTGCLAQGAYYIVSQGEAVIIDPLREVRPYLDKLQQDNAKLKYILETHFHADFVSGHVDLSDKTGASIVYGPTAKPEFEAIIAKDEEVFEIGDIKIKVLHTPDIRWKAHVTCLLTKRKRNSLVFGRYIVLRRCWKTDLAQKVKT